MLMIVIATLQDVSFTHTRTLVTIHETISTLSLLYVFLDVIWIYILASKLNSCIINMYTLMMIA